MSSPYIDPEMHHKICKKMAQLTRVIHKMNTKNIENGVLVKDMVQSYEMELDRVVNECNSIVSQVKTQADKHSKAEEVKEKVRRIENQLEDDKRRTRKEFEQLKTRVEEREKKSSSDLEVELG